MGLSPDVLYCLNYPWNITLLLTENHFNNRLVCLSLSALSSRAGDDDIVSASLLLLLCCTIFH